MKQDKIRQLFTTKVGLIRYGVYSQSEIKRLRAAIPTDNREQKIEIERKAVTIAWAMDRALSRDGQLFDVGTMEDAKTRLENLKAAISIPRWSEMGAMPLWHYLAGPPDGALLRAPDSDTTEGELRVFAYEAILEFLAAAKKFEKHVLEHEADLLLALSAVKKKQANLQRTAVGRVPRDAVVDAIDQLYDLLSCYVSAPPRGVFQKFVDAVLGPRKPIAKRGKGFEEQVKLVWRKRGRVKARVRR